MNKQPEALRLAYRVYDGKTYNPHDMAKELIRQHTVITELVETLKTTHAQIATLPKDYAFDIFPGRSIERAIAAAEAQQ